MSIIIKKNQGGKYLYNKKYENKDKFDAIKLKILNFNWKAERCQNFSN